MIEMRTVWTSGGQRLVTRTDNGHLERVTLERFGRDAMDVQGWRAECEVNAAARASGIPFKGEPDPTPGHQAQMLLTLARELLKLQRAAEPEGGTVSP